MTKPNQHGLIDLQKVFDEVESFEPLPATATRLAALLTSEDWEMEDLVRLITLDGPLTGRLLRIANSAASASQVRLSSVEEAVVRLGAGAVLSLTVGGAVVGRMSEGMPAYGTSEGDLWRHSVASALAAESMKNVWRIAVPPEAFTAALLHDIGKLALSRHLSDGDVALLKRAEAEGGLSQASSESELLEVDHSEIGALIAQHWQLPGPIVRAISAHHDPAGRGGSSILSNVVHLADIVAKEIGEGMGQPAPPRDSHQEVRASLGISDDDFDELCRRVADQLEQTLEWYS